MIWIVIVLAVIVAWFVVGLAIALMLGRAAHIADEQHRDMLFHRGVAKLFIAPDGVLRAERASAERKLVEH